MKVYLLHLYFSDGKSAVAKVYRNEDDANEHAAKVKKPLHDDPSSVTIGEYLGIVHARVEPWEAVE
jgi:hypothetical protein